MERKSGLRGFVEEDVEHATLIHYVLKCAILGNLGGQALSATAGRAFLSAAHAAPRLCGWTCEPGGRAGCRAQRPRHPGWRC